MSRLRQSVWISCFVLLSYSAVLGGAMLLPLISGAELQVVCLGNGGMKLVAVDPEGNGEVVPSQTVSCPLCQVFGPPPVERVTEATRYSPLARALEPVVTAHLTALAGAPLPARGPPRA